jgi:hypothetical protein
LKITITGNNGLLNKKNFKKLLNEKIKFNNKQVYKKEEIKIKKQIKGDGRKKSMPLIGYLFEYFIGLKEEQVNNYFKLNIKERKREIKKYTKEILFNKMYAEKGSEHNDEVFFKEINYIIENSKDIVISINKKINKKSTIINPIFGISIVNTIGADGDYIIENKIMDVKLTERQNNPGIFVKDIHQLILYHMLNTIKKIINKDYIEINDKINIYYVRYKEIKEYSIQALIEKEDYLDIAYRMFLFLQNKLNLDEENKNIEKYQKNKEYTYLKNEVEKIYTNDMIEKAVKETIKLVEIKRDLLDKFDLSTSKEDFEIDELEQSEREFQEIYQNTKKINNLEIEIIKIAEGQSETNKNLLSVLELTKNLLNENIIEVKELKKEIKEYKKDIKEELEEYKADIKEELEEQKAETKKDKKSIITMIIIFSIISSLISSSLIISFFKFFN